MNKTTLKDVAKELNLSINTVSRALRDMPDIKDETKQKIRAAAEKMGYRTNLAASMLRTHRSRGIGVVVSDIANPVFSGMVKGIEFAAKKASYSMILSDSNETYEEEVSALENMYQRNVDGIILFPTMVKDGTVRELLEKEVPFVLVGRKFHDISTNLVINDDFHGGYLAAEHLYSKGHRKFLYIVGPFHMSSAVDRFEGFKQYLIERGLSANAIEVHETNAYWQGGYDTMKELIRKGFEATAAFVFNDFMAVGVLKALRENKIRVPEDMAVMGYDDIDLCELTVPGLTTIDLSKFRLGKRALELLLQQIDGQSSDSRRFQQIIMEPRLVVREST
jgi:LacI family transcriptional regulator